jgi:hypothetical protein
MPHRDRRLIPKDLSFAPTMRHIKRDWEKLYRAAVLNVDLGKRLKRIEKAEVAIRERLGRLSLSQGSDGKEQDAITQALHILSLLRQGGPTG